MKQILMTLMLAGWIQSASADEKAQIRESIDQLKINAENSQSNLEQYKKNMETVKTNLGEVDKALKNLRSMRKQVLENSKKAELNKADLDRQKLVLAGYIKKEDEKKMGEQKQIEALQKKIADLQKNQLKRDENVANYNLKMQEIEREKLEWDEQKKNSEEIVSQISAKEKIASDERTRWAQKDDSYTKEVEKWNREAKFADSNYRKYKKLAP